jgi:hypothetical protein
MKPDRSLVNETGHLDLLATAALFFLLQQSQLHETIAGVLPPHWRVRRPCFVQRSERRTQTCEAHDAVSPGSPGME